jgi:hypothetical protein
MTGVGDASFIPPPLSRLWFIAASATLLRRTGERDRYPGYGADADR